MTTPIAPSQELPLVLNARARGDWATVRSLCDQVLIRRPQDLGILLLLAEGLSNLKEPDAARSVLQRAQDAAPDHPVVMNALATHYLTQKDDTAAQTVLEALDARDPSDNRPALRLIDIARRNGDAMGAARWANRILDRSPGDFFARFTLAELYLETKDPLAALRELDRLQQTQTATGPQQAACGKLRAQALDMLGQFDEAFETLMRANALTRTSKPQAANPNVGPMSPAALARLSGYLDGLTGPIKVDPEQREIAPAFIIGFPRSGTTLLGQILGSHHSAITLDEKPTMQSGFSAFSQALADAPNFRPSETAIGAWREDYWKRVSEFAPGAGRSKTLIIEKKPVGGPLLPLIALLHPAAKIIVVVRDPRDAVLSCIQQRFELNPTMANFLDLDSAAQFFQRIMTLIDKSNAKLGLPTITVRYEDVLADFDKEITRVLGHLGLPWDDAVRRYAATAKRGDIKTPSRAQVMRPLYQSSVGKWRNYAKHLAPVRPILDVWAERFGYSAD